MKFGQQAQRSFPNFDIMVKDSPLLTAIETGATIGSVFGPGGSALGAIIALIFCVIICPSKSFHLISVMVEMNISFFYTDY